jgi:two-component system sensor histidine kinase VicK
LDVPKIESNSLKLNKEKFYLNEFLLDIIKDYKNTYSYFHDYKFHLTSSENDDFLIYADKNRLNQVIYNLIDNSIKYITEGGIISIVYEKKEINSNDDNLKEFVIINIKDTGTGIDTEVLSKIFTKFATTSFQGMGLGLYISKNIVEAHGGKIWAENNKDERGATISFSIPLINDKNDAHLLDENF